MHSTVCGRRRKRGVSRSETRREETKSERVSEARVYANVIAIIPRIGTTIPLTRTKSRRMCSRALWSFSPKTGQENSRDE
ncbi:unnamed protein product [Sphagnum jensenii]|uniref:Uncharacterized protein n=1 Tax=Sphagnum jensenii TaxID=128206 RepID=A0ABP1BKK9_9BRYO